MSASCCKTSSNAPNALTSTLAPLSKDEFLASTQAQDAVIRRLEIIGEAVKSLPADWKDTHPEVEWRQIARMRDLLIHRYFSARATGQRPTRSTAIMGC
jgi:uncharacterized protein with HEPN domain